jgi:predicted choloylglycine hydrolase
MYNMTYRHCIAAGSSYEVGFQLGSQLLSDKDLIRDLTTPLFGGPPFPKELVEKTSALLEKYISGINEEIKGFSDAVNVSYTDMVIYFSYINNPGACSHFIILQNVSRQRKIYHAHNYDFDFSEIPVLITTGTNNKHRSTCFGCKIFGRFDGMNEQGLCVTTSAADVKHTDVWGRVYFSYGCAGNAGTMHVGI